jgi:hypothetical protein
VTSKQKIWFLAKIFWGEKRAGLLIADGADYYNF